jgi:hypothetical protein
MLEKILRMRSKQRGLQVVIFVLVLILVLVVWPWSWSWSSGLGLGRLVLVSVSVLLVLVLVMVLCFYVFSYPVLSCLSDECSCIGCQNDTVTASRSKTAGFIAKYPVDRLWHEIR